MNPSSHIYIHVPFCMAKCSYCNFYSLPFSEALADRYLDAVAKEISSRIGAGSKPQTVYIGGGTPTSLNAKQIARLFASLLKQIDISETEEFTVEINPGTLTDEKTDVLMEFGVNRLSLGIQSFNDSKLRILGRIHDGRKAEKSLESLRSTGFSNIGIDLIYGVPGDTMANWMEDVSRATALGPQHISAYCLSVEPETRLKNSIENGDAALPDENLQKEMYYGAIDFLSSRGYEHYEISNFALPGCRSKHNMATWRYEPYIGAGPSAASFDGSSRRRNIANIDEYVEANGNLFESENLDAVKKAAEVMMLALRTQDGISPKDFRSRTGFDIEETFGKKLNSLKERFLIEDVPGDDAIRIRRKCLFIADEILIEFF